MKKKKRLLGILLSLVLVLGLMPGMSLTAYADDQKAYAAYDVTTDANKTQSGNALTALQVSFNGKKWYIIADNSTAVNAGKVTLLAAESFGTSKFHDSSNAYSTSTIRTTLDNMTASGSFAGVASAINTVKVKGSDSDTEVDAKLYLLSKDEANKVPENVRKFSTEWWLRSPGGDNGVVFVYSGSGNVFNGGSSISEKLGVRPALELDLSKVTFDSATNTFALLPTQYPLCVGGTQVTSANASNIDGDNKASFDPETNTLTLNNYSYSGEGNKSDISATAGIYSNGIDLSIELIGTNTITTNGSAQSQSGIDIVNGNLTITARDNGSLTVTGGNSNEMGSISNGICVRRTLDDSARDSKLTIADGATVNAAVNTTIEFASGTGVYANDGLDVSGTLIADGGNGGQSFGVQTYGDVDVSGTLIATAGSSVVKSYGIYTYKNVTVREGGVVEASAIGNASAEGCKGVGIYTWTAWDESAHSEVAGKVIIEGGEVTASGYDCGIQSRDSVIIKDGKVTATAEEGNGIRCGARNWGTGIYENGTISFEGGSVTASGSDKGVYAQNVSISDGLTAMAGDEAPGADVTNTFATNHDQKWVKVEPPKIPQDITAPDVTVTYGDTDMSVSASVTYPTEGGGAISYAVKGGSKDYIDVDATTGALTIKKVGTATVIVTAAETSTYAQATKEVTVTISKANAVAAKVTANNRTYDGTEKPLVNVDDSTLVGGEMYYAVTTENKAPTDEKLYTTEIPTKTDAGTYYVWYKAVGTDGHADSAVACVTVTISEPSSGGGGGGYTIEPTTETAPSTPTETYTIPVENESSVNVQADIQNGNAKVAEITEEDIHKVTEGSSGEDSQGKTVDNNTILIDLSGATQEVKSVELSKTTMERLAETATSTENKIETVTVQLTNVTVELDAKTLSAVTQQAEGNSINLVVEDTNASTLNSDQQQALSEFTSASTFEAYFESAGSRIHDFRGGEATVSMKFTPAQGLSITHYHVYYVATSGKLERFVTRFIETLIKVEKSDKKGASEGEGILQFTTTHFSDYAIVYDETMENATGREEADDTSSGEDKTKTANGKSSYENGLSINKGLKVSQKGETIQISWSKVKGADGYDVYVQYCGKTFSSKSAMSVNREVTSVTIKKINGKKLNLKKNYKIFVVAYKNVEGKKKRLAKSIVAHIVGAKNTRHSNPKELNITSDTDVTLEKGKTSKIKARVILANAKRKSLSDAHAPMFRYASSDKKIATVDKKGKITAKKQGSCLIWVYAKNGYAKKVKVTVK